MVDTSYSYNFINICIFAVTNILTVNQKTLNVRFLNANFKTKILDLNNFSMKILKLIILDNSVAFIYGSN